MAFTCLFIVQLWCLPFFPRLAQLADTNVVLTHTYSSHSYMQIDLQCIQGCVVISTHASVTRSVSSCSPRFVGPHVQAAPGSHTLSCTSAQISFKGNNNNAATSSTSQLLVCSCPPPPPPIAHCLQSLITVIKEPARTSQLLFFARPTSHPVTSAVVL